MRIWKGRVIALVAPPPEEIQFGWTLGVVPDRGLANIRWIKVPREFLLGIKIGDDLTFREYDDDGKPMEGEASSRSSR